MHAKNALDYDAALIKLAAIKLAARGWDKLARKHLLEALKCRPRIYDMDQQRHRTTEAVLRDCAGTIKNILESK